MKFKVRNPFLLPLETRAAMAAAERGGGRGEGEVLARELLEGCSVVLPRSLPRLRYSRHR